MPRRRCGAEGLRPQRRNGHGELPVADRDRRTTRLPLRLDTAELVVDGILGAHLVELAIDVVLAGPSAIRSSKVPAA
jgi:hypothetical protein